MPGRQFVSSSTYRYGFNGKENDNETVGTGEGTQDYGMRIYNPALGRFLSVDPLFKEFPWYSPYHFAGNMPISAIDLDGGEDKIVIYAKNVKEGTFKKVMNYKDVVKGVDIGALGRGSLIFTYDYKTKNLQFVKFETTVLEDIENYFDGYTVYGTGGSGGEKDKKVNQHHGKFRSFDAAAFVEGILSYFKLDPAKKVKQKEGEDGRDEGLDKGRENLVEGNQEKEPETPSDEDSTVAKYYNNEKDKDPVLEIKYSKKNVPNLGEIEKRDKTKIRVITDKTKR